MSLEAIRTSITTAVEAAKVGFLGGYTLVIEYDNRIIVDTQTQTNPFLQVRTKLLSAEQADISNSPIHRIYGQIHLAAVVKEGSGMKAAYDLLDHFYPRLQRKALGVIRTHMATLAPEIHHLGWCYYPVALPFWSDQVS